MRIRKHHRWVGSICRESLGVWAEGATLSWTQAKAPRQDGWVNSDKPSAGTGVGTDQRWILHQLKDWWYAQSERGVGCKVASGASRGTTTKQKKQVVLANPAYQPREGKASMVVISSEQQTRALWQRKRGWGHGHIIAQSTNRRQTREARRGIDDSFRIVFNHRTRATAWDLSPWEIQERVRCDAKVAYPLRSKEQAERPPKKQRAPKGA